MEHLQGSVGSKAGAEGRGCVVPSPLDYLLELLPRGFVGEVGARRVETGYYQGVKTLGADGSEILVILIDVSARLGIALDGSDAERVDVELHDLIAPADEAQKLALGGLQRGIGHHVQEADVQGADVLIARARRLYDELALVFEALKAGE